MNLKFSEPWSTTFKHDAQIELIGGYKLTTIPVLPLQWKVTFEFKPRNVTDFPKYFLNIFMITGDSCDMECCISNKKCTFQMNYNPGNRMTYNFKDPDGFGYKTLFKYATIGPLLEWTKVEMSQVIECGLVVHRVSINGVKKYREESNAEKNARRLTNLDVYTSGTKAGLYNPPERGFIKGLSIEIREEPKPLRISRNDL